MQDARVVPRQLLHVGALRAKHHREMRRSHGLAIPLGHHVDVVIHHGHAEFRQGVRRLLLEKVVVNVAEDEVETSGGTEPPGLVQQCPILCGPFLMPRPSVELADSRTVMEGGNLMAQRTQGAREMGLRPCASLDHAENIQLAATRRPRTGGRPNAESTLPVPSCR